MADATDASWHDDPPDVVNREMVPPASRVLERTATGRQRRSALLQAGYLLLLVAASAVAVLPPDADRVTDRVAAWMVAAALVARLVLGYRPPSTNWVRARLQLETAKADAWRRGVLGRAEAGDSVRCRALSAAGPAESWARYRRFRVEDQRGWFRRRGDEHRRSARALRALEIVVAVVAVGAVVAQAAAGAPQPWVSLVSTLLATVEAWNQFRRGGVLAAGYAQAESALTCVLDGPDPVDLSAAVTEVEHVLDQERWTWAALSAPAALALRAPSGADSAGCRPTSGPSCVPRRRSDPRGS